MEKIRGLDMKWLAKESLMDCIMFVSNRFKRKGFKIQHSAARMVNKQMNATWLFASAKSSWKNGAHEEVKEFVVQNKIDSLKLRRRKS